MTAQNSQKSERATLPAAGRSLPGSASNSRIAFVPSQGISRALIGAISRMDSSARIRESLALAYWERVVGPQGARASRAESVRDGILFIRTRSSSWSHELNMHKARLLANLNRLLGGSVIKEIYFRAQGVEDPVEQELRDAPTGEELNALELEPGEAEQLRRSLADLKRRVPDPELSAKIAHRVEMEMRLRHWRLERGWRLCGRCMAAHRAPGEICPICRLCP